MAADAVIITADDFGLAKEVNDAVEAAHRTGVLSAASLMVAAPAAAHAAAIARRTPSLRVGLHLTLVDGAPMSPPEAIPDLVDRSGRLRTDMNRLAVALALRPRIRRQLRTEIEAQFAAFCRTGLPLDHVNAHKHFHVHPLIAADVLSIGERYGVRALRVPSEPAAVTGAVEGTSHRQPDPVMTPWTALLRARARRRGLLVPDAVFGLRWSGEMTTVRLVGLLRRLPPGLVEIYTHPATSDAFAGAVPGYGYAAEFAALTAPAVRKALARCDHRLCGFAEGGAPPPPVNATGSRPRETMRSRR